MGLRFLALACLVGAAFAGPLLKLERSQCSMRCSRPFNQKFDYEIGKAYTYEYRAENVISAAGKPKQKSTIEGLAVIQVIDRCEMVLQLKNLRIQQKLSPEEIQELTHKLEEPVSFTFEDGKVEHVCPGPNEDLQSLNIKKGLISSFINTMPKLDSPQQVREFDSLGNCFTKYTVKYVQGLEIRKEKSLKSCSNRHSPVTAFITNPYENPDSKIHTLPIFPEEELVCKQHVEDKIIKTVECREEAKIKPLRHRESVIQFEGKLHLTMLSISLTEPILTARQSRPESIQYNFEERKDDRSRERETEQFLREICSKNQRSMDITVSKDFIQLVSLVKNLPYSSLSKIHSSLKNDRLCSSKKVQDIFADTLPMAGSDAAIKLMVQLLENKEISGLKAKFWPASLALISKPTREIVAEVIPLLKQQPSAIVLLGVSAMVHRYCSVEDCSRETGVQEITAILNKHLGEECSNENESQVFAALKALGNMGYHGDAGKSILSCAQNKDKPTRLRLAAIDAFRRTDKKRPEELLSIYKDRQENSEVRIAVFSCVMKQADAQQIRYIKRVIEQETDDQVSGYTSSFIKNMKKSSSPLKKSLKRFLHEIEINLPKVNYWENSKNIELSTFSETFNVGGSVSTDIIHSHDSKIPRSLTARFDADVLNNNVNVFEVGVRAEGVEAIIKNLVGLKNKMPKHPSWNFLNSDNIFGDAEASLFFRTMNTEIFDLSASDLSGVGEMIKIADFMSQLAQGKSSDFSHSFLFMKSELIIPSVTGRSYSFRLTGSATLGLTASTKLDIMRFPKHTDASAHFQPSMNVEVSTTVGIQSNKQRPDIKLTSRIHLESDMKAQFKIKDGHLAVASISLPSENIVLAKMNSDIVEIDSYHQEKPLFETMQKKIDYCFDKLQKPIGISVCGMLEVPKPFVTKTFPFVHGVGSVEFSIKKTDRDLKSFEIQLEIPKHSRPIKKYRASFDTPGSRIPRRFSAELEVKQQGNSHKGFSLELVSPFKQVGGKGLYTYQPEQLIQGVFELHSSSSQLLALNASAHISSSRAKKVIKPSLKVVIGNNQPLELEGNMSITKGRKQLISVDIKTNKPSRQPFAIKGSILKDGSLELSKKAEWKISSDLSLRSMFFDTQIRSTVEKQSKQAQTVSASLEADYKRGTQKHSIKLSGTSQQSSSKLSTNAQFQSTQFPKTDWSLKWEMQGKLKQSLKNDITLKYGRNPERQYVSIRQNSILPMSGPGQCNVVVKAPQLSIDSELTLKHEIVTGQSPKIHLEADMCYKENKHIKGLLDLNYLTRRPLKAHSRAEIEYPGGNFKYSDEIEETSTNKFEGKAQMQWKKSKKVELSYAYQILSGGSEFHHKLETSLRLPRRPTPIESKASLKLSTESVAVEGSINLRQESPYSFEAHFNKVGESQIQLQTPKVEGHLKLMNERQQKVIDMDLRFKGRSPRRVTALTRTQLGNVKSYEAEISWDADRRPDQKVSLSTTLQIRGSKYHTKSELQVTDHINIVINESGDRSLLGNHEGQVDASLKRYPSISIEYSHELTKESINSRVKFSKNGAEKAEMKLVGKLQRNGYSRQCYVKTILTSLDRSFENKELEVELEQQQPSSSTNLKTSLRLQISPIKTYKVEMSSENQPNGIKIKALAQTPHKGFSKQSAVMSIQKSENSFSTLFSIELPENKEISIASELQKKIHEMKSTVALKLPFAILRDVQVYFSLDNHRNKKNILSYLDINNARICDVDASVTKVSSDETSVQGHFHLSPISNIQFQGVSVTCKKSRNSFEVSGDIKMQGSKEVSLVSKILKERSGLSMTASLSTPFKAIKLISTSYKQSRIMTELTASALYMDNKEMSVKSQILREQSKLAATVTLLTPYKIKETKAHISLESQESKKNLLAYIDSNGERKGDIEASYITSTKGVEMQSRWKTAHNAEVSSHAKFERSGKSYSLSTKVMKGASRLMSTNYQTQTDSLEKILFDLQVSREFSRNGDQYSMKLSGPMTPVSLRISTSHSESNALKIEANACHGVQESDCVELKAIRKALNNAEGYRHYQKITLDLQKCSQKSSMEKFFTADIIFSTTEHDYKSKMAVEYQGKNIGYEVQVHRREHEHDHCSIDAHIFAPQQTSRLRASILHEQNQLLLEVEAVPDSSIPQKKIGFEMRKEYNERKQELTGYLKLSHPKIEKPILLTGRVQKEGRVPKSCKVELQYSSITGSRVASKVLTFEVESKLQPRSSEKALICKLFNEDKSLNVSLQMKKEQLREHVSYGYEWSYKTRSGQKKGGVLIKMSHKKAGQPSNIDISYYTPSMDLKIQGRATQAPTDLSISLLSSGRMIKEIVIKSSDNCVEMEVIRSGPFFKSSFCINKNVGDAVRFVSLEAYYRRHKCLDISIGTEPENPAFMEVNMQWKKDDLCQALSEITGLSTLLHDRTLQELERELKTELNHLKNDIIVPAYQHWMQELKKVMRERWETIKDVMTHHHRILKSHSLYQQYETLKISFVDWAKELISVGYIQNEVLKPLSQALKCLFDSYFQLVLKHIPDVLRIVVDVTKEQFEHCLKKFCVTGTFCHDFRRTYERDGLKKACKVMYQKMEQSKKRVQLKLSAENPFTEIVQKIQHIMSYIQRKLDETVGKFFESKLISSMKAYIKKIEHKLREQAICYFDKLIEKINEIFSRAERDEDFRTAKYLVKDAQKKLKSAWKNKEKIAAEKWEPLKQNMLKKGKEILRDRLKVTEFDPKQGNIQIRIRHPLKQRHIQVVKNAITVTKQRIQQSVLI